MRRIDTYMYKISYPDSFVPHPDIGHRHMVHEIFPYLADSRMPVEEFYKYVRATYIAICQDFDAYEEYLADEYFKNNLKKK